MTDNTSSVHPFLEQREHADTTMGRHRWNFSFGKSQRATMAFALSAAVLGASAGVFAQIVPAAPAPPVAGEQAPDAQQAPHFTDDQLDQLVAPIALYPDPLIAEILPASTFPVEIVEADRWVSQNPTQANDAGINAQSWDDPVKALAHYPTVLKYLSDNIQYTQELGAAFMNQQQDITNAIQRQRAKAAAVGNLVTTPQQTVQNDNGTIYVEPTNPQTIYVPTYDPNSIYYQNLATPFYWGSGYGYGSWLDLDFDWGNHGIVYGRHYYDGSHWQWRDPHGPTPIGHRPGGPPQPRGPIFHPGAYVRPAGRPGPLPPATYVHPDPVADRGRFTPAPEPRGAFGDYPARTEVQHETGRVAPAEPVHVAPAPQRIITPSAPRDNGAGVHAEPSGPMGTPHPSGPVGGGGAPAGGGGGAPHGGGGGGGGGGGHR